MRPREYGQFRGLARAAEVLGQRWPRPLDRLCRDAPRRRARTRARCPPPTGARPGFTRPREGEIVTTASLVTALRVAAGNGLTPDRRRLVYTVRVGDAVAHMIVHGRTVEVVPGEHPEPDLVITGGPEFRDLLAGTLDPETAVADGVVEIDGDPALLTPFVATFTVPYSTASRA